MNGRVRGGTREGGGGTPKFDHVRGDRREEMVSDEEGGGGTRGTSRDKERQGRTMRDGGTRTGGTRREREEEREGRGEERRGRARTILTPLQV
jgi:hypothetical protein